MLSNNARVSAPFGKQLCILNCNIYNPFSHLSNVLSTMSLATLWLRHDKRAYAERIYYIRNRESNMCNLAKYNSCEIISLIHTIALISAIINNCVPWIRFLRSTKKNKCNIVKNCGCHAPTLCVQCREKLHSYKHIAPTQYRHIWK